MLKKGKVANFAVKKNLMSLAGYTFIFFAVLSLLCYDDPGFYSYSCMMYVLGVNS